MLEVKDNLTISGLLEQDIYKQATTQVTPGKEVTLRGCDT